MDFIFPKICIVTGNRLDDNNSNNYIEDDVMQSITRVDKKDLIDLKNEVNSDFVFALYSFDEGSPIQQIIHHFKYRGMKGVGIFLGELISEELLSNHITVPDNFDLIIPIPLYKTKLRERGFNQSDYLCKGINNSLKVNFTKDLVKRTRHTESQTKLSPDERVENVMDAFEIKEKYKGKIEGKKIILVDDVVTTGSTLNEVIKELREESVSQIYVITVAMAKK